MTTKTVRSNSARWLVGGRYDSFWFVKSIERQGSIWLIHLVDVEPGLVPSAHRFWRRLIKRIRRFLHA